MRQSFLFFFLFYSTVYSAVAFGSSNMPKKVVVVEGPYILVVEGETSKDSARVFKTRLEKAVEAAGCNLLNIENNLECEDSDCLESARSVHNADDAVFVKVEQLGAKHTITLVFAKRQSVTSTVTGTLSQVYEKLDELVKEAFKPNSNESVLDSSSSSSSSTLSSDISQNTQSNLTLPIQSENKAKLKPHIFWSTFGLTLSLAGGGVGLEVAGYRKLKELDKKTKQERTKEDIAFQQPMRIAEAALFGGALISAVVTSVLAFKTDFKKKKTERKVSVMPALDDNAGLVLKGAF